MGNDLVHISHLQFEDNTLLFCKNDDQMLEILFDTNKGFEWLSGLKVNWDKSTICGVDTENQKVSMIAQKLNCKVKFFPLLYLGLPLGGNPKSLDFWNPVQQNISKKLHRWKRLHLSGWGRC